MIVNSNENPLWFIISKGDEIQYGMLESEMILESIYPIHTYVNEDKWKLELLKLGIDIDEINKENSPQDPEPYVELEPEFERPQFFNKK